MTNIDDFKDRKRAEQVISDLVQVRRLFDLAQHVLKPFRRYVPVDAVLSAIYDNQVMVHLHIVKFKKFLDGTKDD